MIPVTSLALQVDDPCIVLLWGLLLFVVLYVKMIESPSQGGAWYSERKLKTLERPKDKTTLNLKDKINNAKNSTFTKQLLSLDDLGQLGNISFLVMKLRRFA